MAAHVAPDALFRMARPGISMLCGHDCDTQIRRHHPTPNKRDASWPKQRAWCSAQCGSCGQPEVDRLLEADGLRPLPQANQHPSRHTT